MQKRVVGRKRRLAGGPGAVGPACVEKAGLHAKFIGLQLSQDFHWLHKFLVLLVFLASCPIILHLCASASLLLAPKQLPLSSDQTSV